VVIDMPQTYELDLKGKNCDEFISELSRALINAKPGESVHVVADPDRLACLHMILKASPRYIYKGDIVGDHSDITIKRIR